LRCTVIPGRIEDASPEVRDELSKLDLPGLVLRTIPERRMRERP
jgi:hypothetical protein